MGDVEVVGVYDTDPQRVKSLRTPTPFEASRGSMTSFSNLTGDDRVST